MHARVMEVTLGEMLGPNQVLANMSETTKKSAVEELVDLLCEQKLLTNKSDAIARIMEREDLASTALGDGVAIPHARLDVGEKPVIAIGRHPEGIDFHSPDGKPVQLIILVLWQPAQPGLFNRLFAGLVSKLADASFRKRLIEEKDNNAIAASLADVKIDMLAGRATKVEGDMLITLQLLETKRSADAKGLDRQIQLARAELPGSMLSRFDRLMAHHGEALVEAPQGICTGCSMTLSSGVAAEMLRNPDTIFVCERCGRFLIHHI